MPQMNNCLIHPLLCSYHMCIYYIYTPYSLQCILKYVYTQIYLHVHTQTDTHTHTHTHTHTGCWHRRYECRTTGTTTEELVATDNTLSLVHDLIQWILLLESYIVWVLCTLYIQQVTGEREKMLTNSFLILSSSSQLKLDWHWQVRDCPRKIFQLTELRWEGVGGAAILINDVTDKRS